MDKESKRLVFTGGGTAGHVMANLVLIDKLKHNTLFYIGSKDGIEKELVKGIPYYSIPSGKLRRYASIENFKDVFRVFLGIIKAFFILGKLKPNLVFSKGGFVSVPVVIAAWLRRLPIVIHESDLTPGLANKISSRFAKRVCTSYEVTATCFGAKGIYTGLPIKEDFYVADGRAGAKLLNFERNLPVVLIICGSLGSVRINKFIEDNITEFLMDFNLVHLIGKGNKPVTESEGYRAFEFVGEELPEIFAASDVIVSRAGSTIFEILAARKPSILIPLPKRVSRGDQEENAAEIERLGLARVIDEENLDYERFVIGLKELYNQRNNINYSIIQNGSDKVLDIISNSM